jgi:uncharacterized membrane protein HdeD (DUF308 family)
VPFKLSWKWTAARGALAVAFGVAAIAWPAKTLAVIVVAFGAYALVDGCYLCVSALSARGERNRGMYLAAGLAGTLLGIFMLAVPTTSLVLLLYAVAAWAILKGILEIIVALRLRALIEGEWLYGLAGALSLALGVIIFASPSLGAVVFLTWLALYALLFGAVLIGIALRLRRAQLHLATLGR